MATSIADTKRWLRELDAAGRTSYGFFAEYLYAVTMRATHKVKCVHTGGVDFMLDGKIKVDVKSRLYLDCKAYATFPREPNRNRLPEVAYPHVVFYDDTVVIYDPEPKANPLPISWEQMAAHFADYNNARKRRIYFPRNPIQINANEQVLKDLIAWIKANWNMKAKRVRRSSPVAMKGMNKSEWGPEAFYLYPRDRSNGIQLVVLVYFGLVSRICG